MPANIAKMDFTVDATDEKYKAKVKELVHKAQYAKALQLSREMKKKYKHKAIYYIDEAVLIGDQPSNDPIIGIAKKKKAARLLKPFVRYADKMEGIYRVRFLNEYYWFSEQPQKQYELGVETVNTGVFRGYYSQGVGASFYAHQLMKKGKISQAQKWAKISEKAWLRYFSKVGKTYYNAYCWYALALGLQMKFEQMYKAFSTAEKLANQPSTYPEFYYFKNLIFDSLTKNAVKDLSKTQKFPTYWYIYNEPLRHTLMEQRRLLTKGDSLAFYKASMANTKSFNTDPYAHIFSWALWGDWGQHFSEETERKYKAEAVRNFAKIKKEMAFPNWYVEMVFENEVYYHSARFLDQYNLGKRTNDSRPGLGDFSMGVGSSELANQYRQNGKITAAKKWAKVSIAVWKNFYKDRGGKIEEDYFYIQALYCAGQKALARKLLFKVMANQSDFENAVWARHLKRWAVI